MGHTHAGAPREEHAAPTVAPPRPELTLGFTPQTILALQRTAGNQAVTRAVTAELRQAPPPPPMPPASERASPENRHLAAEIDTVAQLPDAKLEDQRAVAANQTGRTSGADHEKAVQSLDALEYVASMRRLGPRKLDWKNYDYVRQDAGKRRAFVRGAVEQGVRETGSFEAATAGLRDRGGKELDGDLWLLEQDAKTFATEFRGQAHINAERMMRGSLHAIAEVLGSYGLPATSAAVAAERILKGSGTEEEARTVVKRAKDEPGVNADPAVTHRMRLAEWVEHLKKHQKAVKDLQKRTNQAAMDFPMDGKGPKATAHSELKHELAIATTELAAAWIQAERAHPVLAAYRGTTKALEKIDLGTLDTASVDDQMQQVLQHILPKVAHIAKADQMIKSGTISPLALPAVVGLTKANMFVPSGSIRDGVANDLAHKASRDTEPTWMIVASVALAIVTLVPSGGASLAVATGIAGASLAAYTAVKEYEHYDEQKVLIDTDLDRARTLSQEEPSLTGFAVALISLGLEGLPLIHAFKVALDIKRLKAAGGEADKVKRLVDELNKLGKEKNAPKLGEQALDEAGAAGKPRTGGRSSGKPPEPPPSGLPEDEIHALYGEPVEVPAGEHAPHSKPAKLAEVRARFSSRAEVRKAVLDKLSALKHGTNPADMPPGWGLVQIALKMSAEGSNPQIEKLLPIVMKGLRDPELYADVVADAWVMLRADRDMTHVLMEMAAADGFPVRILPKEAGIMQDEKFFEYATEKAHWLDNPLVNTNHTASLHLIQDIVVNRGFAAAGVKCTSAEFRALLREAAGELNPDQFRRTAGAVWLGDKTVKTGDLIWRFTYDSQMFGHINKPEETGIILKLLLDVL